MKRLDFALMATWIPLYLGADILTTTWLWLHATGIAHEANQLGVLAFMGGGFWGLVGFKLIAIGLVTPGLLFLYREHEQGRLKFNYSRLFTLIMVALSIVVVGNNLFIAATVK